MLLKLTDVHGAGEHRGLLLGKILTPKNRPGVDSYTMMLRV